MSKVKAFVKKINRDDKFIQDTFRDEFIDDLIRNEGKLVILHNFWEDEYEVNYKLISDDTAKWHVSGNGNGKNQWTVGEIHDIFDMIFCICRIKPVKFDEDLFNV